MTAWMPRSSWSSSKSTQIKPFSTCSQKRIGKNSGLLISPKMKQIFSKRISSVLHRISWTIVRILIAQLMAASRPFTRIRSSDSIWRVTSQYDSTNVATRVATRASKCLSIFLITWPLIIRTKMKNSSAHSPGVIQNLDKSGFWETMRKPIRMCTNSTASILDVTRNTTPDLTWRCTCENMQVFVHLYVISAENSIYRSGTWRSTRGRVALAKLTWILQHQRISLPLPATMWPCNN